MGTPQNPAAGWNLGGLKMTLRSSKVCKNGAKKHKAKLKIPHNGGRNQVNPEDGFSHNYQHEDRATQMTAMGTSKTKWEQVSSYA